MPIDALAQGLDIAVTRGDRIAVELILKSAANFGTTTNYSLHRHRQPITVISAYEHPGMSHLG
jgi:hypothetical protein